LPSPDNRTARDPRNARQTGRPPAPITWRVIWSGANRGRSGTGTSSGSALRFSESKFHSPPRFVALHQIAGAPPHFAVEILHPQRFGMPPSFRVAQETKSSWLARKRVIGGFRDPPPALRASSAQLRAPAIPTVRSSPPGSHHGVDGLASAPPKSPGLSGRIEFEVIDGEAIVTQA
jgi:hypothetical protein